MIRFRSSVASRFSRSLLAAALVASALPAFAQVPPKPTLTPPPKGTPPPPVPAPTPGPTELTIPHGGSTTFEGQKIQFMAVKEDSRCPVGTKCATAGIVVVSVNVSSTLTKSLPVALQLDDTGKSSGTVGAHKFTLVSVTPVPTAKVPKPPVASYVLVVKVERIVVQK